MSFVSGAPPAEGKGSNFAAGRLRRDSVVVWGFIGFTALLTVASGITGWKQAHSAPRAIDPPGQALREP